MKTSKSKGRIVVGGIFFYFPLAGVAWQHLHYLIGLKRLGWDVSYVEIGQWYPYNPDDTYANDDGTMTTDITPILAWGAKLLDRYGFGEDWHYYSEWDGKSFGLDYSEARKRIREADAFINLCGSHILTDDHLACPRRIFLESDPVALQVSLIQGDQSDFQHVKQHTVHFSFGENLGSEACPLDTCGVTWHPTRQVVILDEWRGAPLPDKTAHYTTVGNWDAKGKDITIGDRVYHWRKGLEFLKVIELPKKVHVGFDLAMNFGNPSDRVMLESHGWKTRSALELSRDPDEYRLFIQRSRAEFTVAKEQNIVFQTGWFSDRAVTYLASGRPVINQDTGFARNLPVGNGLYSFQNESDCVAAIESIESNYELNCKAATEIAEEYFSFERVLPPLLDIAGL